MDHYEVLGVARDASAAEIRRAYLKLARTHHPDFHSTDSDAQRAGAERRMQRINEAWLVLGDRRRRADYDLTLPASRAEREWARGTAHPDFVPVDEEPDRWSGPGGQDDLDDDLDLDEGEGTGRRVPTWQQILPAACLAGAVAVSSAAMVLGSRGLLALGVVLLVAAGAGFVLTPMLAVLRTYERDPER